MAVTGLAPALPRVKPAAPARLRDGRLLVGLLLGVLVFAGGLAYWNTVAGPRTALTVARDVPAGVALSEADLVVTRVRVDGPLADQLVTGDELAALIGRPVAEPLHAGELLVRAHLAQRPGPAPGQVLLAIPLKPEAGPGAAAQPGSRVRVLATIGRAGGGEATTSVVLPEAQVAEVVYQPRSALLTAGEPRASGGGEPVVLRVLASDAEATAVARAKVLGTIEVVLLGPGESRPTEARP